MFMRVLDDRPLPSIRWVDEGSRGRRYGLNGIRARMICNALERRRRPFRENRGPVKTGVRVDFRQLFAFCPRERLMAPKMRAFIDFLVDQTAAHEDEISGATC